MPMKKTIAAVLALCGTLLWPAPALRSQVPAQQDEVFTTASGLQYRIVKKGNGPAAEPGKKITLHGIGSFPNGTVFWNSREDGEPFAFVLGKDRVIKGCSEGVALMRAGDRFIFTMKPELAYGDRGKGRDIPPGATLIFDYEILSVEIP